MTTAIDEVKDVPLIYPLVSVKISTTAIVDDRLVLNECEEIINVNEGLAAKKQLSRLMREFNDYVRKVIETAKSPQARDALQNILDTHQRASSPNPEDRPSSPATEADPDQGSLPLEPPAPLPERASL